MWWTGLTLVQKIFFLIACPASVLLVVQIILMLIGFGGEGDVDADVDTDFDVDADGTDVTMDSDVGLSIFTVRGLTAFFTVGGWVGFTLGEINPALSIVSALVSGTIALLLMAVILKWLIKLQSNGNVQLSDGIGKTAEVYLTIPPKDSGEGKINITLNEKLCEFNAIQKGTEPIKTGDKVKIIEIIGNTYVVEKL